MPSHAIESGRRVSSGNTFARTSFRLKSISGDASISLRSCIVRNQLLSFAVFSCCVLGYTSIALGCPFCVAVKPTLAQQRGSADVVLFAELIDSNEDSQQYRIHHVLKGQPRVEGAESLTVPADIVRENGTLAILFGNIEDDALDSARWTITPVNETSLGYFAQAPPNRASPRERLAYYARFLQHRDPVIAEDAYLEFGHAPFADVVQVADKLPSDRLRAWVDDLNIPQERKGFYALALGFPRSKEDTDTNSAFLREIILAPASDFRAGFDGVIGGYLLGAGVPGLELIEQQILKNPDAAEGDLRHVANALRAYYEFGQNIPPERLAESVRLLLTRPSLAATSVIDLSRWGDWGALPEVVDLYDTADSPSIALRRSIVGYLIACPLEEAETAVAKLRGIDPQGVAEAERFIQATSGGRSSS